MSGATTIGWCDATFNPWWGCERVSPGCAHCYADTWAKRVGEGGLWSDGAGAEHRIRHSSEANWREPLKWARTLPEKLGRRPRVFCASMADVFENRNDLDEPRMRLFELIEATPELDWLVLTKRPEFAHDYLVEAVYACDMGPSLHRPLPNLWIGVSIENARHTWRADVLRGIPAAVKFISAEPLLGSLYAVNYGPCPGCGSYLPPGDRRAGWCAVCAVNPPGLEPVFKSKRPLTLDGIDWVIVGGESGPRARMHSLEWSYEVVHACQAAQLPVFVKQLGAKPWIPPELFIGRTPLRGTLITGHLVLNNKKGEDPSEWPTDLRYQEWPTSPASVA